MSNRRKLRVSKGGKFVRNPQSWSGQPANRLTMEEAAKQQAEARKPRFVYTHRDSRYDTPEQGGSNAELSDTPAE